MINGKNIILGVCGGIAAFKAAALTSKLVQAGANVKVIMTKSSKEFVTPLTFQALSRQPVYDDTFVEPDPSKIAHIDIADWADVVLVAPTTANIMAKLATGIADDMLTTTLLATTAPVYLAPAMNVNMYDKASVQRNVRTLRQDGYQIIDGVEGYLACGWTGKGRMAEPDDLLALLEHHFTNKEGRLKDKTVVITAGPTQERIDPVRYFTNHSSGKMGYAVAEAAREEGANVILISGPTHISPPTGVKIVDVVSAKEMFDAAMRYYHEADIVIKSAAVADYRPKETFDQKRKKQPGAWSIEMERTTDILKTMGEQKEAQILVGFAAESEQVEDYARKKLHSKNLDLIVANNITQAGAGFKGDTNIITIITKDDTKKEYPVLAKKEAATCIISDIVSYMERHHRL
ncbi:bifunctional phosphopantothenoylcysteine decarboxylase/phosphopantothenate--cysteine ligase CoaBC [Alkalihalobacillus sp. MEB130]|uniref:bifunctional phosphopantothenoylcysteine decarboxylase/phosphopantothenate--cysteine ligase CoaBC n=1 Tax=Alkalihalobacillus sp. MEB130 TaxID=2976704 RepID=UPI0028DF269B|nr:bifunctional phosphopantothenoylcysteine decarboxylase/phosphopantothenate--cysteine ligase CoaBC [Alkalihalobacillus sp. MEB130]MDT8859081.1 bifunctional phosphopantothenoylcysteine decarboxylase/phosphopantothenate--cysteine ligase CoaBC [Alkalihalobacillus sp. MEB130]